jgi:hypothetical protein
LQRAAKKNAAGNRLKNLKNALLNASINRQAQQQECSSIPAANIITTPLSLITTKVFSLISE